MARLARMVVPGLPHHVMQRGNRREAIFFEDGDQDLLLEHRDEPSLHYGAPKVLAARLAPPRS